MSSRSFSLQPFPEAGLVSSLKFAGEISRVSNRLAIHYELFGHLTEVVIPMPVDMPARKNALWEETCFEFFIAVKDSSQYWEFNLSPAGHWNVFRFAAYRKGMQEDMAIGSLPLRVRRQSITLSLSLEINLDRVLHRDQALEVGISAVIKQCDGMMSYWSLSHPGPQADFHRRDGFLIEL
ncbi:MAG: DOMON-like domain-containing protein [Deltaproteobacteria bacterium]|nr:DOMON-like domain-containing protein [Deltaproteobacteria bacterium]